MTLSGSGRAETHKNRNSPRCSLADTFKCMHRTVSVAIVVVLVRGVGVVWRGGLEAPNVPCCPGM